MKIVFIHHSGFFGGASNSLISILKHLDKDKIDIYLITPNGNVVEEFRKITSNILVLKTPSPPTFFPSAEGTKLIAFRSIIGFIKNYSGAAEILKYIDEVKPDIVHFNDSIFLPVLLKITKNKFKIVMHARARPSLRRNIFDRINDYFINKHVDLLLCISESVRTGFSKIKKAAVLKNPLQFSELELYNLKQSEGKNIENQKIKCLFLSNYFDFKGIKETIESAITLKDEKNIEFLIAGSAPRSEEFFNSLFGRILDLLNLYPDFNKYIRKNIKINNLKNIVILGQVKNLKNLLEDCHINLAPVWLDAPPRSVFEAGAYGMPSILALYNKNADSVIHGETGLIITPKNSTELANAIKNIISNPDQYYKMSLQAKKKALEDHDPKILANKLVSYYETLFS